MIILLDLNYTLVENSNVKLSPFARQINQEQYRKWLVDAVRQHYTILMTARPHKYRQMTLDRIHTLTQWQPQEAYFNDLNISPPEIKRSILTRFVLPAHGQDGSLYYAIESNPKTTAMYSQFNIQSVRVDDSTCKQLLTG